MSGCMRWISVVGIALALLLPAGGCFIAADLVNPDLLSSFGIAPGTFTGQPGQVLVVLNNATSFSADMSAVVTLDAAGTEFQDVRRADLAAGDVWIGSFDCPVYAVTPGRLVAGAIDTTAVTVVGSGDQPIDLAYTGTGVQSTDYTCGDVIEIRLLQVGAGAADTDFLIQVFVRPGR